MGVPEGGPSGTTRLTPGKAQEIGNQLLSGADGLSKSTFHRSQLTESHFGGGEKPEALAREYRLSYHVVTNTMKGFETDLNYYAGAVINSARDLEETDEDGARMTRSLARIKPTYHDQQAHDTAYNTPPPASDSLEREAPGQDGGDS